MGAVNVSVLGVAPWEGYITALTPNFTLSATDAVSKVIPRTGVTEEKIIDALSLNARMGIPQTSKSITKTTNIKSTKAGGEEAEETQDSTESRTKKKEPGKIPDAASKAQGADKGIKELPGVSDSAKTLHNDPILEYTAATALYQEVQLLNRYVTDAALKHDMNAYIVRLQIGIVPFRRNMGYDLYTKIGFFPKDSKKTAYPAYILPLLVTDNIEGTLASRSQDTIRQLSLAISAMQAGIIGTVGADRLKEVFESELFTEPNSLFTIGRVTDNTLGARFGAVRQGKTQYSIIPRTHNATIVMMVPKNYPAHISDGEKESSHVRVVTRTLMRSTKNGKILPQQEKGDRIRHVGEAIKMYLSKKEERDSVETKVCKVIKTNKVLCTLAVLESIWKNDYTEFEDALKCAGWLDSIGRFKHDLWMDIVESLDKSHFSGARFELPKPATVSLPPDQAIFLLDDGKKQAQSLLTGGTGIVSNQLRAVLRLKLKTGESIPLVGSVAPENGGADVVVTFPSLAIWKLNKLNLAETSLELEQHLHPRWGGNDGLKSFTYTKINYRIVE